MKRILLVIDNLRRCGAQRQLVELVKGLLLTGKYQVWVISLQNCDGFSSALMSLGVKVEYYPRKFKYDLFSPLSRLIFFIRKNEIDMVHTVMNMGSLFGCLAAKLTGRPVVCSAIRDAKDKSLSEKYLKILFSKLADIYVANSCSGFANRFKTFENNFRVIYNGVDFSRFNLEKNASLAGLKNDLGLGGFRYLVGMVASFSLFKDQDTLIAAVPKVLVKLPEVGFFFVGDGPRKNELEKLVADSGFGDRVKFLGQRDDVDCLYGLMDVCVLLTAAKIHLEGISNALVEAMASGVPVVASLGGGTSELVEDGESGFLVPPYDSEVVAKKIVALLEDKKLVESISFKAKERVHARFNLDRYVADYEKVYDELFTLKSYRHQVS